MLRLLISWPEIAGETTGMPRARLSELPDKLIVAAYAISKLLSGIVLMVYWYIPRVCRPLIPD